MLSPLRLVASGPGTTALAVLAPHADGRAAVVVAAVYHPVCTPSRRRRRRAPAQVRQSKVLARDHGRAHGDDAGNLRKGVPSWDAATNTAGRRRATTTRDYARVRGGLILRHVLDTDLLLASEPSLALASCPRLARSQHDLPSRPPAPSPGFFTRVRLGARAGCQKKQSLQ